MIAYSRYSYYYAILFKLYSPSRTLFIVCHSTNSPTSFSVHIPRICIISCFIVENLFVSRLLHVSPVLFPTFQCLISLYGILDTRYLHQIQTRIYLSERNSSLSSLRSTPVESRPSRSEPADVPCSLQKHIITSA